MQNREEPMFVVEPMMAGETIQRRYQAAYSKLAEASRQHPVVNLGAVEGLRLILRGLPDGPEWPEQDGSVIGIIEQARRHLVDAANAALPRDVRIQHLDIAGSLVWNAKDICGYEIPMFAEFMQRYVNAGGA